MTVKDKYFYTQVTGISKSEVDRRVAELEQKGYEVVGSKTESVTVTSYKRTESIGRSKNKFDGREEREKHITRMRRLNTK